MRAASDAVVWATEDGHLNLVLAVITGIIPASQRAAWVRENLPLTGRELFDLAIVPEQPALPPKRIRTRPHRRVKTLTLAASGRVQSHGSAVLTRTPMGPRGAYAMRSCADCLSTYWPGTGNQIRCHGCAARRERKRLTHRYPVRYYAPRCCVVCGAGYAPRSATQITCGRACQQARLKVNMLRWWQAKGAQQQREEYAARRAARSNGAEHVTDVVHEVQTVAVLA